MVGQAFPQHRQLSTSGHNSRLFDKNVSLLEKFGTENRPQPLTVRKIVSCCCLYLQHWPALLTKQTTKQKLPLKHEGTSMRRNGSAHRQLTVGGVGSTWWPHLCSAWLYSQDCVGMYRRGWTDITFSFLFKIRCTCYTETNFTSISPNRQGLNRRASLERWTVDGSVMLSWCFLSWEATPLILVNFKMISFLLKMYEMNIWI